MKAARVNNSNFFSEPRESYPNYDNDVNHAADVEEPPELFTKIPGSTLGIDAMVTVSKYVTYSTLKQSYSQVKFTSTLIDVVVLRIGV